MRKYSIVLLLLILAALVTTSCQQKDSKVHIKVLATADVHAAIFPHNFTTDTPMDGSLAHVSAYVNQERANRDQHIVLLDNGDLLQGQPTGYFANFIATDEVNLFAKVMNYIGFDAASVGNHDIEAGSDVYNQLKNEFRFPWLAANILDQKTGKPYFKPYQIIEKDGVKIAVLGLITSSVPNWLPQTLWEGLEFTGMHQAAVQWVEYIRDHEKPHAIIGLFHSGEGDGSEEAATNLQIENASLFVAENVPGFDVVFTAHDHRVRNRYVENIDGEQVLIIGGHPHGRSVAAVDLQFTRGSGGNYILSETQGQIVGMDQFTPDEEFLVHFQEDYNNVQAFVDRTLGVLERDLHSKKAYAGNSAFVDFIHKMQLELTDAQISFAAPLSFNATLAKGDLTMRDMFRLYPYENYLYVMELTGAEIKDFLEYSYGLWYTTMENEDDHIMLLRKNEQGELALDRQGRARFANAFFNFDSASGLDYEVDVTQPVGSRIKIKGLSEGGRFIPDRTYRVAINSYRGSGGGGHLTHGAGIDHAALSERIVWTSDNDLRSYLAGYIEKQSPVEPKADNNWKVVPEEWTANAIERDYGLIFED
ncbi:MAG: bifunctional metallophosphatase/5'-nucleotidase [Bacteroidota bacterium]